MWNWLSTSMNKVYSASSQSTDRSDGKESRYYQVKASNQSNEIIPREKINYLLFFQHVINDEAYNNATKRIFYYPSFIPVLLMYLANFIILFINNSGRLIDHELNDFSIISGLLYGFLIFLLLIYLAAQTIEFFKSSFNRQALMFSKYALNGLNGFLFGNSEELILLALSLSKGFGLISNTYCMTCDDLEENSFIGNIFDGYIAIFILPIFLKSVNRHWILCNWVIYTAFVISDIITNEVEFNIRYIVIIVFFMVVFYEFQRSKMNSFIIGMEALLEEQNKLALISQKSKDIERKLNQALVHQILPPKVAEAIRQGKQVPPESFDEVTIFFSDVVGFTNICAQVSPMEVIAMLNELYTVMDYCTSHFPLYKVETIGDAYMVVGGLPTRDPRHAQYVANFAFLVRHAVQQVKSPVDGSPINIRIGLHSGAVMAGVVGNLMPRYCLFGDTVNTASRMESNGQPGFIHCSAATADILLKAGKHSVTKRGDIEIKGKGIMTTYWLDAGTADNIDANEAAIHRLDAMVKDILIASHEDNGMNAIGVLNSPRRNSTVTTTYDNLTTVSVGTKASANEIAIDSNFSSTNNLESITDDSGTATCKSSPDGTTITTRELQTSLFNSNLTLGTFLQTTRHIVSGGTAQKTAAGIVKQSSSTSVSGGKISVDLTGAKILIVEDSPAQRKMLLKRLTQADPTWELSSAMDGEDALQKLRASKNLFDVVFVDENLSNNDGFLGHELVDIMRNHLKMTSCVIIACTSNPAKVKGDLIAAGVDYVWPKPPPSSSIIKSKIESLVAMKMRKLSVSEPFETK